VQKQLLFFLITFTGLVQDESEQQVTLLNKTQ